MQNIGGAVIAVVSGLIGLAVVAVIVGTNAQTPTILTNAGQALSQVIGAAVAPVSSNNNTFGSNGQIA